MGYDPKGRAFVVFGKKMMRGGYKHNKKERNWMLQKNKTQRYVEIKCQLDATEVLLQILLLAQHVSGHHYAHHQELKSISKTCLKRTPYIYRKPGQTENKFRNGVISHVK